MKKGFTLIELLIVIAIIGILTTIILSALGDSKTKAYDSQVKQQLARFRSSAEIYSSNQSPAGYTPATNDCTAGMFGDVTEGDGAPGVYILPANLPGVTPVCQSTQFQYAVWAPLPSGSSYFCVDSKGAAKVNPNPVPAGPILQCP
jgi:prepilin-type N-terminal cleavage/methylation domain-containing protein